jgi:hypothetical protein
MGLLEDINSGKYNLIIIIIGLVFIFHIYWQQNKIEKMADVSTDIKDAIQKYYNADVESIRNLSDVATKLQAGGLAVPGNLIMKGPILTDHNVPHPDTIDGAIYRADENLTIAADDLIKFRCTTKKANTIEMNVADGTINLNGKIQENGANLIPRGIIVAWSGTEAPAGWAICDGRKVGDFQTPDLRGRFVRMFSDNLTGDKGFADYVVTKPLNSSIDKSILGNSRTDPNSSIFKMKIGEFGGTDYQVLHVNEMPVHSHGIPGNNACFKNGGCDTRFSIDAGNAVQLGTFNAGGGWGHNNIPPFYVLAYIIKL